jgi:hypothetical protein
MTVNARALSEAGHLRPGITVAQAADILWTYSSPELYELLVLSRGWPAEHYGHFVAQAMIAALLPPPAPGQSAPADSRAPDAQHARPDQPDLWRQAPPSI